MATNGTAFSSSDQTGGINTTTPGANTTAAAFLPPSLFKLISNRTDVGTFFLLFTTVEYFSQLQMKHKQILQLQLS